MKKHRGQIKQSTGTINNRASERERERENRPERKKQGKKKATSPTDPRINVSIKSIRNEKKA